MKHVWWALVFCFGCASELADDAPVWDTTVSPDDMPAIDCSQASDHMPTERRERQTVFWSDDAVLRDALSAALVRLNAATGLGLEVAPAGMPVIRLDLPEGTLGYAGRWRLEIEPGVGGALLEDVVVHELGHVLGAPHLGPGEGIMTRCLGAERASITEADLMLICSAAPCSTFQPETLY